jgi:hypothetical protein
MPGIKIAPLDLTRFKPSAEEMAGALAILAKAKPQETRSKMASMVQWLKAQPDKDVMESRGEVRQEYLAKFMVHQMRSKGGAKKVVTTHNVEIKDKSGTKWVWMSRETMDVKLGAKKGQHWRESGQLKVRDDLMTGSKDPDLIEYRVPKNFQEITDEDLKALCVAGEQEATEESLALVASASHCLGPASTVSGDKVETKVKAEQESECDKLDKKIKYLEDNPRLVYDEFTTMSVVAKEIKKNSEKEASKMIYAGALIQDVDKHIVQVIKLMRMLEKLLHTAPLKTEIPKLINALEVARTEHVKIVEWSTRFSLYEGPTKGVKRAKK